MPAARAVQRAMLPVRLVLTVLLGLALPLSAASIAEQLAAAKWTHHAKAPGYSEGPTWVAGEVFFCSGALLKVDKTGKVFPWLDINPAGTFLRRDGQILVVDNKHKAVLALATNGVVAVLADQFEGKPLRGLNDVTVDARGNIYWTDPEGSSLAKPIGDIYRLNVAGIVTRVASGFAFPNGLDVDPASLFLYLIESQSKKILRLALPASDDAPLGSPDVFYDLGGCKQRCIQNFVESFNAARRVNDIADGAEFQMAAAGAQRADRNFAGMQSDACFQFRMGDIAIEIIDCIAHR